jgi:tetratricopeptide (TPR) repeat protein
VESVAWVAERKDLLCALFFLLSIMAYTKYADSQQSKDGESAKSGPKNGFLNKYYFRALGFFILALLSKPMAVTLPVVFLILDWHPFNRIQSFKAIRPVFVEKLPFMALTCASSIVTVLAQKAGGAFSTLEIVPLSIRMLVGAKALISYLGKIAAPLYLAPFYPYPRDVSFTSWRYLSMPVLVIAMTAGCIAIVKKRPFWTAAWAYYVVTLLPVLGIVQVGAQSMADRYTYLPSLGPFLVAGGAVAWISSKGKTEKNKRDIGRKMIIIMICLVFTGMTYGTIRQIGVWKNGVDLWGRVIEQERERAPMAYYYRGSVFEKRGQLDKALEDYTRAITIYPSYVEAYSDRGAVFEKMGLVERALEDFDRAIDLDPSYYHAYNNKGTLYGKAGSFGEAIASFNKAIEVNPGFADAYFNRGVTFVFMGQYAGALQDFNRAIFLNPNDASFYAERGNLYKKTGNKELAMADFRKACDLGYENGCAALRESAQGLGHE